MLGSRPVLPRCAHHAGSLADDQGLAFTLGLTGLAKALRPLGLATGKAGFNGAVLTFFAKDHATSDMVYANADITKAEQAAEIIAFADYCQTVPSPE